MVMLPKVAKGAFLWQVIRKHVKQHTILQRARVYHVTASLDYSKETPNPFISPLVWGGFCEGMDHL